MPQSSQSDGYTIRLSSVSFNGFTGVNHGRTNSGFFSYIKIKKMWKTVHTKLWQPYGHMKKAANLAQNSFFHLLQSFGNIFYFNLTSDDERQVFRL